MEWKRRNLRICPQMLSPLGNFLSGMETLLPVYGLYTSTPLETSLVEWKHLFLPEILLYAAVLGNFLSGMETPMHGLGQACHRFPWKLP